MFTNQIQLVTNNHQKLEIWYLALDGVQMFRPLDRVFLAY